MDGRKRIVLDDFVACGGAKAMDIPGHVTALDTDTDLVTVSVGGNDIYWIEAVATCILADEATCKGAVNRSRTAVVQSLPGLLEARYRKVRTAARKLSAASIPRDYHRVRRRLKKLRYLLEAVAPLYHKRADRALQALRRWQDTLGALQDAAVSGDSLKAMASSADQRFPPATLLLMGRLLEHHERAARRARERQRKRCRRFQRRWARLSRRLRD